MKWIKLEERKPGKGHNYFVKATRKGQGYLHNDTALYRLELDTWEFMHDNGTYVVEWLDETPITTVAPAVSEEGGIEEAADKYIKRQGSHDRPDITKHDFKQGYIAGANSVRQQRDRLNRKQIKDIFLKHINLSDTTDGYVVSAINELTIEEGFIGALEECLSQSPSIPQPGFIEKLRDSNPYEGMKLRKHYCYDVYNECVDKASKILNSQSIDSTLTPLK